MVLAALKLGLGKAFLTPLALSKLAHGLHNGYGVTVVSLNSLAAGSEVPVPAASGQYFNLNCVHGGDSCIPAACMLHHQRLAPSLWA